jgi:transposase
MLPTKELFVLWQKVRDGTLSWPAFVEQMKPIRAEVESLLLRSYFHARVAGFCKGLWEHRQNLWTFVKVEGVEPTNNTAEQALRQAVIWRKLSFGTQSAAGSRFVERLLTVVETCRRQKRNVLSWMIEAVEARFAGKTAFLSCPGCEPLPQIQEASMHGNNVLTGRGSMRLFCPAAPCVLKQSG